VDAHILIYGELICRTFVNHCITQIAQSLQVVQIGLPQRKVGFRDFFQNLNSSSEIFSRQRLGASSYVLVYNLGSGFAEKNAGFDLSASNGLRRTSSKRIARQIVHVAIKYS